MSIESKLSAWGKSKHFQAKVTTWRSYGGSGGEGSASYGVKTKRIATKKASEIERHLVDWICLRLPNIPRDMFEVIGPIVDKSGNCSFELFFKSSAVGRPSLYRAGYPDGLENVIALISHGSAPSKKSVWNNVAGYEWNYREKLFRGEHRQIGYYREGQRYFVPKGHSVKPDDFLRSYVDQLNAAYKSDNITIRLHSKYYP